MFSRFGFINLYPIILQDIKLLIIIKASWLSCLKHWITCNEVALHWFESIWRHIFILNFSLLHRSEQVSEAHANEIKHGHSPEVIVVLDLRYDKSHKVLYIYSRSIALNKRHIQHLWDASNAYVKLKFGWYESYCRRFLIYSHLSRLSSVSCNQRHRNFGVRLQLIEAITMDRYDTLSMRINSLIDNIFINKRIKEIKPKSISSFSASDLLRW